MGEMLIPSALVGIHSQKLPINNRMLSPLKRAALSKSTLLETENLLVGQDISKVHNEQPQVKKHKKLFLEECQVVLDLPLSMSIKKKQLLRRKILDNGGTISYVVTRKSDLVISVGQELSSLKQKMAKKYNVPVVMQIYIDKCIEEQRMLDTKEFLVSSGLKTDGFCKGKIIADSMTDSLPFAKSKVVLLSSLTPHSCEEMNGYILVKAVLLKGRNLHKAVMNKRLHFYVLELHTSSGEKDVDSSKQFCVSTDEGYLDKEQNGNIIHRKKQCYYLETADDALSVYSQLYFSKAGQPHCMIEANELLHPSLGTPEFQKLQLEWNATLIRADENILRLVDVIWMEALGHLNKFLSVAPEFIPLWKVDEAEGILLQISTLLSRDEREEMVERLSIDFYSVLPHHPEYALPVVSKKVLSQKQDLCQVLRDMVSVSEASGWSLDGHLQAKYRALRCHIEDVVSRPEYDKIKQLLIESQHHSSEIVIEEIYSVYRYLEAAEFTHHLSNKQLLFHATSPSNLIGILSQGLNLPKVVVQERGIERFDIGMLGGGIYFTDSLSTCIKYSRRSKERGTRFLLVSEVALGNVHETTTFDISLTAPPHGFNSVHGVKATESAPSDFMDDEFVIYSPNQQRMCYLVEFTLPEDEIKPYCIKVDESEPDTTDYGIYTLDMKDAIEEPKAKQTSRLEGKHGTEAVDIPLKEVHIRAKLLDLVAQVVVFQQYKNLNDSPLECKYVFPLERGAAVCGFEAFINNKHVIGKIKRKEVAHKEYKEAISKGHGAYLMDEESPDVFTVSVGNIPPLAIVIIKITYILELPVSDEVISFNIPTSVAPWIKNQVKNQATQDVTDSLAVEDGCIYSVAVSVEMPFPINTICSPTHDILMKRTETMAVVEATDNNVDSSDGFSLLISLKEIHVPRMWTETHEENDHSQASMLVFYPEFEVKQDQCSEIIIVVDASNSMKGDAFQSALQVAVLCLMEIPHNCYFNIVTFGTVFQELFPSSQEWNPANMKKAKGFLKNTMPSFGNTELFHLLRYFNVTAGNTVKNVIIISDGHINNEGTVLRNAKMYCSKVRLFTCGVSATANKHMLCQLSCWGGGAFEFMDPMDKNNWKSKIKAQIDRATQAALANVRIEWQNFTDSTDFLQAPQQIMSIFNGCRQVVYGFIPNCTMAKLVAVIDGKEYETMVSSSSLNEPEGIMLHTLAARAVIRDWEDGLLAIDRISNLAERKLKEEQIVELSKEYNLVTSITSFIAVEERDSDEEIFTDEALMTRVLNDVDIDELVYMEFESLAKGQTKHYKLSSPGQPFEKSDFERSRSGSFEENSFLLSCCDAEIFSEESSDESSASKDHSHSSASREFLDSVDTSVVKISGYVDYDDSFEVCEKIHSAVARVKAMSEKTRIAQAMSAVEPLTCNVERICSEEHSLDVGVLHGRSKRALRLRRSMPQQLDYEEVKEGAELAGDPAECYFNSAETSETQERPSTDETNWKDLLKCKGSLPLCNAVYRHICTFARENGMDIGEFLNGTLTLDGWELEEEIDIDELKLQNKDIAFIEVLKTFVEKIKTNGYCEETDCLKMGIMEPFARVLEDSGLNSLGNKTALDIRRMLATLAVIMYLSCWLLTVAKEKVSGQHNFQKLENLSQLFALTLLDNSLFTAPIFVALQFVRNVEQRHPLVYKSLNCGNNWEEFIIDYVAKPPDPPERLSWEEILCHSKASACYIATE